MPMAIGPHLYRCRKGRQGLLSQDVFCQDIAIAYGQIVHTFAA